MPSSTVWPAFLPYHTSNSKHQKKGRARGQDFFIRGGLGRGAEAFLWSFKIVGGRRVNANRRLVCPRGALEGAGRGLEALLVLTILEMGPRLLTIRIVTT